jgi:hypothetical protein
MSAAFRLRQPATIVRICESINPRASSVRNQDKNPRYMVEKLATESNVNKKTE